MEDNCINYMHFGSALQYRDSTIWNHLRGVHNKKDALSIIRSGKLANWDFAELIRSYGPERSQRLDIEEFRRELDDSAIYRPQFSSLKCRGFSHRVAADIEFSEKFASYISVRIALLACKDLFYPPRVKAYLRRANRNHYFSGGFPSIAFSLGTKLGDEWYVFVLQSDLAFHTPAYVRGHFGGWARILLSAIINKARNDAKAIYLCRAGDALRTCHPSFPIPQQVPASLEAIYDRTARLFGMQLMKLQKPINIQLYPSQKPMLADSFYKLEVSTLTNFDAEVFRGGTDERCKSD